MEIRELLLTTAASSAQYSFVTTSHEEIDDLIYATYHVLRIRRRISRVVLNVHCPFKRYGIAPEMSILLSEIAAGLVERNEEASLITFKMPRLTCIFCV